MDRITVLEKENKRLKNELEHYKKRVTWLKYKLYDILLSSGEIEKEEDNKWLFKRFNV